MHQWLYINKYIYLQEVTLSRRKCYQCVWNFCCCYCGGGGRTRSPSAPWPGNAPLVAVTAAGRLPPNSLGMAQLRLGPDMAAMAPAMAETPGPAPMAPGQPSPQSPGPSVTCWPGRMEASPLTLGGAAPPPRQSSSTIRNGRT